MPQIIRFHISDMVKANIALLLELEGEIYPSKRHLLDACQRAFAETSEPDTRCDDEYIDVDIYDRFSVSTYNLRTEKCLMTHRRGNGAPARRRKTMARKIYHLVCVDDKGWLEGPGGPEALWGEYVDLKDRFFATRADADAAAEDFNAVDYAAEVLSILTEDEKENFDRADHQPAFAVREMTARDALRWIALYEADEDAFAAVSSMAGVALTPEEADEDSIMDRDVIQQWLDANFPE
jgi:hypothetical protein